MLGFLAFWQMRRPPEFKGLDKPLERLTEQNWPSTPVYLLERNELIRTQNTSERGWNPSTLVLTRTVLWYSREQYQSTEYALEGRILVLCLSWPNCGTAWTKRHLAGLTAFRAELLLPSAAQNALTPRRAHPCSSVKRPECAAASPRVDPFSARRCRVLAQGPPCCRRAAWRTGPW